VNCILNVAAHRQAIDRVVNRGIEATTLIGGSPSSWHGWVLLGIAYGVRHQLLVYFATIRGFVHKTQIYCVPAS
jgi:hypothetical protein